MNSDATPASRQTPSDQPQRPSDPEKLASRLALVSEISRSAQSKLEMGELLSTVAQSIHRNFEYYDVSIFLIDSKTKDCILIAQSGEFKADGLEGYRQASGVGIVGWVAEHGQTLVANDIKKEARHIIAFEGEDRFQSELAVPIRLEGETVGVINVQCCKLNAFDDCDVMALETLTEQIAQAISNAQLFERTRLLRDLNRSIIDAMPSGLCLLDDNLNVLYANPRFCSIFGQDAGPLAGEHVHDVLASDLLEEQGVEKALRAALIEQTTHTFNDITAHCKGTDHALNVQVVPAHMPEGAGVLIVFEDVTQWHSAMALAEERREHLDLIVQHVPIAVFSFNLEGVFTYWGAGAKKLFDLSESETVGQIKPFELLEDSNAFESLIETCRERGSAEQEFFITQRDGARLPVLAILGKLMDRHGEHVGYSAVVVDIRERHRNREELLREKSKLDNVVGVIGAGLALIDRDKRIVWANPTIDEWFGRGEVIEGKNCYAVYCRRDTDCSVCPATTCFMTGENSEAEVALIRADGELRQYHHAVTPVIGPTGEVEQVLNLTLDVTDQTKKVYQLSRLRQLGELMQGVLDLDRLLHFVLTCVTAGQALGFNRAILMLVDSERQLIEGKMGVGPATAEEAGRIWSAITEHAPTLEDLLARYESYTERPLSAMDQIAHKIRVPLADHSHILTHCALSKRTILVEDAHHDARVSSDFHHLIGANEFILVPLIARNRPVGIIMADNLYSRHPISEEHVELLRMFANQAAIAIENASNYKTLDEEKGHLETAYRDLAEAQGQLVRSERLVAIGRMAAHVAHEIRNPLVTIGGFANMIMRQPPPEESRVQRYAQIISSEVKRLESILGRVMDFSKPTRPLLRDVSIFHLIEETMDQFRERANSQNVELALQRDEEDLVLPLDPDHMKQVFINLFQNALDVMLDGGRLDVSVAREGDVVSIQVHNTGEAIRPEDLPSLFEPFFSTKPSGTGLGLAVSHKIVQEHGGDIRVVSSTAKGTTFAITLPISPSP